MKFIWNISKQTTNFMEKMGFVDSGFVKTCDELVIGHISSIPTLSMEVFSSAHSILFQHCHIDEIESSAFSGVLVNNITFDSSSVDRIHTSAFPDRALLQVSDYR